MMRIRLSSGAFIIGLDAEDIRRLTNKEPIFIDLEKIGGTDKVLIMAGETLNDVAKEIEKKIGVTLPTVNMPEKMQ
jgi:hypothetical protein